MFKATPGSGIPRRIYITRLEVGLPAQLSWKADSLEGA